jgi:hypothetical protein
MFTEFSPSGVKSIGMRVTPWLVQALVSVGVVAVGCSSSGGDDKPKEAGTLACNQPATECRAGFADTYEGTYTGDASGRVILDVDVLGGIVGTATKADGSSVAIFGQVNEFGKITAEADDGTQFVGQFEADGSFTGTWTGPNGSDGTFSGTSTTPTTGTGGRSGAGGASSGGSAGGSTSTDPLATDPRFIPSLDAICDAIVACGQDRKECEEQVVLLRGGAAQAGCIDELNAFFACAVGAGTCDASVQCQGVFDSLMTCG